METLHSQNLSNRIYPFSEGGLNKAIKFSSSFRNFLKASTRTTLRCWAIISGRPKLLRFRSIKTGRNVLGFCSRNTMQSTTMQSTVQRWMRTSYLWDLKLIFPSRSACLSRTSLSMANRFSGKVSGERVISWNSWAGTSSLWKGLSAISFGTSTKVSRITTWNLFSSPTWRSCSKSILNGLPTSISFTRSCLRTHKYRRWASSATKTTITSLPI